MAYYKVVTNGYYSSNVGISGLSTRSQWAKKYKAGETTRAVPGSIGIMIFNSLRAAVDFITLYSDCIKNARILKVEAVGSVGPLRLMASVSLLYKHSARFISERLFLVHEYDNHSGACICPAVKVISEVQRHVTGGFCEEPCTTA